MSSKLNEFQNATVGMAVGVVEVRVMEITGVDGLARCCTNPFYVHSNASFFQVLILQPFNYAKNMAQQRKPIQIGPVMYRGVGANAGV